MFQFFGRLLASFSHSARMYVPGPVRCLCIRCSKARTAYGKLPLSLCCRCCANKAPLIQGGARGLSLTTDHPAALPLCSFLAPQAGKKILLSPFA
jgi:hypothetical protein